MIPRNQRNIVIDNIDIHKYHWTLTYLDVARQPNRSPELEISLCYDGSYSEVLKK